MASVSEEQRQPHGNSWTPETSQIGALEQMIGTSLLERAPGRPVRLTLAGDAFYVHALDALTQLRTGAEEAVSAETSRTAARLRLGTYPSVAARMLPRLLDRLAEMCPSADVALTESTSPEQLERAVEAGGLDLTFAVQPFTRPGVDGIALCEDPFCLLVARDSELADRRFPVTLDELGGLPLILSGTCAHLRHLEARLRLRGHEPRIAMHTDDDGLAHGLVAARLGVAVLTRLQVDPHRDDLAAVDLADVIPPRIVALAWARRRPLPPLAEALRGWAEEQTLQREMCA